MKRSAFVLLALVVGYAATQLGCMDRQPAAVCPVPLELKADNIDVGGWDGVDLLVMVDDSISMGQEQAILATSFFPLVNALSHPLPTWQYGPADEMRLAVVTSNLGFSSYDPQAGESVVNDSYWPTSVPASCVGKGDNGKFQAAFGGTVNIQNDVIPCDDTDVQCPPGWTCEGLDADGIGKCHTAGATDVSCPSLAASWAETSLDAPNADFAMQAACLGQQGTQGCGFEQQLQSSVVALVRSDQTAFMKDTHLLAVILVSDEEDCSMRNGQGLFGEDEVQNQSDGLVNVACGRHPEHLLDVDYFQDAFEDAKGKGPGAVIFAAIVGVPYGSQEGANECQGSGGDLGGCLDTGPMTPTEEVIENLTYFAPACERGTVTKASPGIRYVELAQKMGDMAYVYSICNEDWSPAMEEVADLIASKMGGTCFKKPLDWDPTARVAKCNVVVEYVNPEGDECPPEFGDVEPVIKKETTGEGEETTHVYCPVAKLPSAQDCSEQTDAEADAIAGSFGWYYCENLDEENFAEACVPSEGIDNDGDGATDCDDSECEECVVCGGMDPCNTNCRYVVKLTEQAKQAIGAQPVAVQCIQQFSFEDRNCQEDTLAACTDSLDNDGNGIWDCNSETEEEVDVSGEKGHLADPNCCPMTGVGGGVCDLAPTGIEFTYEDTCPEDQVGYEGGYPDACREAASRIGCTLP